VDDPSGVDVGGLGPFARHGEDVLLPGDLLAAVPAAEDLRLKKKRRTSHCRLGFPKPIFVDFFSLQNLDFT
jgi:hypothetical protein